MSEKEMISSKMASRTAKRLKEYAEREGISKSQAVEDMVRQGLDVQESDMRLVPVRADGGTELEDKIGKVGEKIDSRKEVQKLLNTLLVVGITWIGLQLAFDGLGPIFSFVTGIPIILGLLFSLFKEGVDL